jgi:hypothetical protein
MSKLFTAILILNIIALTAVAGVFFYQQCQPKLDEDNIWHSAQYGNRCVIYGPAEIHIRGSGFIHRVSSPNSKIGAYEFKNRKGTLYVYAYPAAMHVGDQPDIMGETHSKYPEIDVDIKQLSAMVRVNTYSTPRALVIFQWEPE